MKQFYVLFLFLISTTLAFAQIPSNDEIQNAINITSLPFTDTDVQTQNATVASGGDMIGCGLGTNFSRVYYRYSPTQDVTINASISQSTSQSAVLFYQSSVQNATTDSQLTYVGNNCTLNFSEDAVQLLANNVYYILIVNPDISCDLELTEIQFPSNDLIENAIDVTGFNLPYTFEDVQLQLATSASGGGMVSCDLFNSFDRIYYRFAPTEDVSMGIHVTSEFLFDSFVLIYQSSVANAVSDSQLTYVGNNCADDFDYDAVDFLSGNVYYILVGGASSAADITFSDTSADIVSFSDPNFKTRVLNHDPVIDFTGDGEIQLFEALIPTELVLDGSSDNLDISNFSGLEAFTNLEILNIEGEDNNFDFGFLPNLSSLTFKNSDITSLNVSNASNLIFLDCSNNELNTLEISQNSLLEELDCGLNQLSSLDVSQNLLLENLNCRENEIMNLDVSQNPNLIILNCVNNLITNINVTQNLVLEELSCESNDIASIDVTQNSVLKVLKIGGSLISDIDISQNLDLEEFSSIGSLIQSFDVTPHQNLKSLLCGGESLQSLDVTQNSGLENLAVRFTSLGNIDVTQNPLLKTLQCDYNLLTDLDVSQNLILEELWCANNQITDLDLTQNIELVQLIARFNNLVNLDLSQNINFGGAIQGGLSIQNNYFLENINLKNGNNTTISNNEFIATDCPNLQTICVDDVDYANTTFTSMPPYVTFVEDCSVLVNRNTIEGTISFDENNDGCNDQDLTFANVLVSASNGFETYRTFSDSNGYYRLFVGENSFQTFLFQQSYFSISPPSYFDTFTGFDNVETSNFCFTASQSVNDLRVTILPLNKARPGSNARYQLVFENVGPTTLSGSINFEYDGTKQSFVSASQSEVSSTSNSLSFDFIDIQPFENRTIDLVLNTFDTPIVNDNDILNFTASIVFSDVDNTPENNTYVLNQIVNNLNQITLNESIDSNDKLVLQGSEILLEQADDYLDYIVRFQNNGTESVTNVVVTEDIISPLNFFTLVPLSSSHDYTVRIRNNTLVEFIFENINLPAQQDDDLGSNGFIAFKVKPINGVSVGDIITGEANIYFDFNSPILTNMVSTEIVDTLSDIDFINEDSVVFYPNPTDGLMNVKTSNGIELESITIFGLDGKEVMKINEPKTMFDISELANGVYFAQIRTNVGLINKRIIKD